MNVFYAGMHHTNRTLLKNKWTMLVRAALPMDVAMFNAPVNITIHAYYTGNPVDPDNIAAKLVIDGMKGIVIADDNPACVRDVTLRSTKYKENAVWVEVKPSGTAL